MPENDFTSKQRISPLVGTEIYCPKCRTKNSFTFGSNGKLLDYFCVRCSCRMNDFWDAYLQNNIELTLCNICEKWSFNGLSYCINCGKKLPPAKVSLAKQIVEPEKSEIKASFEEIQTDAEIKKKARKIHLKVAFSTCFVAIVIAVIILAIIALIIWRFFVYLFNTCSESDPVACSYLIFNSRICDSYNHISKREILNSIMNILKWLLFSLIG